MEISIGLGIMPQISATIKLLSLLFFLSFAAWSCEKDDPKPSGNANPNTNNPLIGDTSSYDLQIMVTGFDNTDGQIVLALFDSERRFNNDDPIVGILEPLDSNSYSLVIQDLLSGDYGISCYHDANEDEKLNTNILGIPQEGFGFSTNPSVSFSAPGWEDIRFMLDAQDTIQIIELKYF